MSSTTPADACTEPAFWHVDDIDWTEVQRQRNADGSVSVVREKWPIIRPDFLSAYAHYEPGMVVRRHGHRSNHVVVVVEGAAWIGGRWCTPGTHFHVPLGAAFGPIIGGPDGVTCWELSFGEFGGWGDEPELYEHEITLRGAAPLPDPPLEIGEWFRDPRGDSGAERPTPRIPGLDEVVTDLDGLPWNEVQRQRTSLGAIATVRAKWPIATTEFVSALVALDPHAAIARHVRDGHHLVFVTNGGVWIGDRWCPAGSHIEVPPGVPIGPLVAGDRGATYLAMTDGAPVARLVEGDPADAGLERHGLTPLPDPSNSIEDWLAHTVRPTPNTEGS